MTKERKPAGKKAFLVQARKYLATLKRKEKKRKNLSDLHEMIGVFGLSVLGQ